MRSLIIAIVYVTYLGCTGMKLLIAELNTIISIINFDLWSMGFKPHLQEIHKSNKTKDTTSWK